MGVKHRYRIIDVSVCVRGGMELVSKKKPVIAHLASC